MYRVTYLYYEKILIQIQKSGGLWQGILFFIFLKIRCTRWDSSLQKKSLFKLTDLKEFYNLRDTWGV